MRNELILAVVVYLAYILFRELNLVVHVGYTLLTFIVLRFFPDNCKTLVQATLLWQIFDLIDAFVIGSKYEDEYKCTRTASISKSETTDDEVPHQNLSEKDLQSSSSQPPMDELTPHEDSTSTHQSTDAQ